MTMGLRNHRGTWLNIDDNYLMEHNLRKDLLKKMGKSVLGCLPIADEACQELLDTVVQYLSRDFPHLIQVDNKEDTRLVRVVETGEIFDIDSPRNGKAALELAAKLAMEDLSILMKGPNGDHVLYVVTFPVHMDLLT